MSKTPTTAEIEKHLSLVRTVVFRHRHYVSELHTYEDLLSWGTIGLVHALTNFDETRGFKFSTYAYKCIWGYLLQGMRSSVKERWSDRSKKPKVKAVNVSISVETVERELKSEVDENWIINQVDYHTLKQRIGAALQKLTPKQREVVVLMMKHNMNQTEVADTLGCSRQNVFGVWESACKQMRVLCGDKSTLSLAGIEG